MCLDPGEDGVAGGIETGLGVLVQAHDGVLAGGQKHRVKYLLFVSFTK
jgi:hypothetical protein